MWWIDEFECYFRQSTNHCTLFSLDNTDYDCPNCDYSEEDSEQDDNEDDEQCNVQSSQDILLNEVRFFHFYSVANYRPEHANLQFSLCVTQIICEIRFCSFLEVKNCNFGHFGGPEFWFLRELHISKCWKYSNFHFETLIFYVKSNLAIFRSPKTAILVNLELDALNLILEKIPHFKRF